MQNDAVKLNNNSRREFLMQGSILAGGLIAAPLLSKANYFSGSDDVIKIVLIGCGGRGTGAAMQALLSKQNVKLTMVAGKILYENGEFFIGTDAYKIYEKANDIAERIVK